MSQRELAEAVTAYVFRKTERDVSLDRHYISRLERGRSRWPTADYRDAFRAVLGAATDAELGFHRASGTQPKPRSAPHTPVVAFAGPAHSPHAVRNR
jgi:transcriptional regulator with XRE-family HTH domain